jgi:non-ribosomal peptide synthetase component F
MTSFSFDSPVLEIFYPLCNSSIIELAPIGIEKDLEALLKFIVERRVAIITFVPSVLKVFLSIREDNDTMSPLKYVTVGGEELPLFLVQEFYRKLPNALLYDGYGPTEATINVTNRLCLPGQTMATIGTAMPNIKIYILNSSQQQLPIGISGELCIGGVGLARGYLNRADLTGERFIANPFVSAKEKREGRNLRIYRSGDLARYRSDGNIEYLGRIDEQVKIRGFRIECGEIESVIRQASEAVKDVVVVAREDESGNKRLVSYLILKLGESIDGREEMEGAEEVLKKREQVIIQVFLN